MNLKKELEQLDWLLDSGDLTPEQHGAEKRRLVDCCVRKIEAWYENPPKVVRNMPGVVRGTVRYVSFSDLKKTATVWLDLHIVTVKRTDRPIPIAVGDQLLVVGYTKKIGWSFGAVFYINETNGDNSVDESRKIGGKAMMAGAIGTLGSVAVWVVAAILALRDPSFFSMGGIARTSVYLISFGGALAVGAASLFILGAGSYMHGLLHMIDSGHLKKDAP